MKVGDLVWRDGKAARVSKGDVWDKVSLDYVNQVGVGVNGVPVSGLKPIVPRFKDVNGDFWNFSEPKEKYVRDFEGQTRSLGELEDQYGPLEPVDPDFNGDSVRDREGDVWDYYPIWGRYNMRDNDGVVNGNTGLPLWKLQKEWGPLDRLPENQRRADTVQEAVQELRQQVEEKREALRFQKLQDAFPVGCTVRFRPQEFEVIGWDSERVQVQETDGSEKVQWVETADIEVVRYPMPKIGEVWVTSEDEEGDRMAYFVTQWNEDNHKVQLTNAVGWNEWRSKAELDRDGWSRIH